MALAAADLGVGQPGRGLRQPHGAHGEGAAQQHGHRREPDGGRPRALRDGGLRPGPDPLPLVRGRLLAHHRDAAHPGGRHLRPQLRARLLPGLDLDVARPHHPRTLPGAGDLPLPTVLPLLPEGDRGAAALDGLSWWGTFWRVVVPNSGGFAAAIGTITFIGSWNAFLWPLVIGRTPDSWTVQIALSTYLTAQTSQISTLFMAALVAILPLLLMFLLLQRWIVQGVERTGISD
ncbi:ABC transporter permease subunit [Serinicoccus sp. CUA-874]|uniref:ABC transporter permease subunit n=1 Tax=Serinicoccus sp. CUA-874 TaxID=1517939 RepID=UPI002AA29DE1|nr:ABC transporter permease subunit [Serinicoccus sp. CUA-874]